jgi:hypothetical protein
MRGNVLLAVITLMVAMLLLAPAILGGGEHRGGRKKSAAVAAGPGVHLHHRRAAPGDPLRWLRSSSRARISDRRAQRAAGPDHSLPRAPRTSA